MDLSKYAAKLKNAKTPEEITEIMGKEGAAVSPEEAERVFLKRQRSQDRELSLEELDAVAGGADRDWLTDGCAATVEPDSWCGSDDACVWDDVTYDHEPVAVCPECGAYMYEAYSWERVYYKCSACDHWEYRKY